LFDGSATCASHHSVPLWCYMMLYDIIWCSMKLRYTTMAQFESHRNDTRIKSIHEAPSQASSETSSKAFSDHRTCSPPAMKLFQREISRSCLTKLNSNKTKQKLKSFL
jgi:hypothetical protein